MFGDTLIHRTMEGFIRADRLHRALCDRETAEVGVHRSQNRMLSYLSMYGDMSQKELAERMHITPAVVTVMVQKLLEAGYVRRMEHPLDRRAYLISITEEGQKVVDHTCAILDGVDKATFEGFTPEELEQLLTYCRRMIENMERHGAQEGHI